MEVTEEHVVESTHPASVKVTEVSEIIEEVELLSTGLYSIRTVPSLQLIGRNIVEDASPDPKGVYGQPLGVPMNDNTTFMLRYAGGLRGDSYHITVGRDRGRVVGLEGRVAAVFHGLPDEVVGGYGLGLNEAGDPYYYDELPMNQRWAVRRQPQHGDGIYTIESENGYWGWVMPTEHPQYTRVAVRQLSATATMPPMYPPTMIWLIERIG